MQNKGNGNLIGIDVTSGYGTINWAQVATNTPKISFAYMRCSFTATADTQFVTNVKEARKVGILAGGFHNATPSTNTTDAITQSNFFIDKLQLGFGVGQYGDINPFVTITVPYPRNDATLTTAQLLEWIVTFKTHFENVTNRTLIIYTNTDFIDSYQNFLYPIPGNRVLDMPLMISYISILSPPDKGGWDKWLLWQYSLTETVSGITGNVHMEAGPVILQDLQQFSSPPNYDDNLYVTDKSLNLKVVLSNNNNPTTGGCPYYEAYHLEQLNKTNTLTFSVPSDNEDSASITVGNCVYYRDYDDINQIHLFEIIRVEETHEDVPFKNVYCEHKAFELLDTWINSYSATGASFETILTAILGIAKWKAGIIQVPGTATVNITKRNKMDIIQYLINLFGAGEIRYRVQISENGVVDKFIDILNPRGTNIGKRFEYTKDLKSIKRTIDTSSLITLCYGYGNDSFPNFSSVVWTKPPNPANKPAGQLWVRDVDALAHYGRYGGTVDREGIYENTEVTSATDLLNRTWAYLQQHNFPFSSYEMSAVDFEFLFGYSHERVRLGDTVGVIDKELSEEIVIEIRVVEINRCLSEPEKTSFVIGNTMPVLGGTKA